MRKNEARQELRFHLDSPPANRYSQTYLSYDVENPTRPRRLYAPL